MVKVDENADAKVGWRVRALRSVVPFLVAAPLLVVTPTAAAADDGNDSASVRPVPGTIDSVAVSSAGGPGGGHSTRWMNDGPGSISGLRVELNFPREVVAAIESRPQNGLFVVVEQVTVISTEATAPVTPTAKPLDRSAHPLGPPDVNPSDGTRVSGFAAPGSSIALITSDNRALASATAGDDGAFDISLDSAVAPGTPITVHQADHFVWPDRDQFQLHIMEHCTTPFAHTLTCDLPGLVIPSGAIFELILPTIIGPTAPVDPTTIWQPTNAVLAHGTQRVASPLQTRVVELFPVESAVEPPAPDATAVTGTGNTGSRVTLVTDQGDLLGPVQIGTDGTWSLPLPGGSGTLAPTFTDIAGNAVRGVPVPYGPLGGTEIVSPRTEAVSAAHRPHVVVRSSAVHAGDQQQAVGTGFLPDEEITATMNSTPLPLGTQRADDRGQVVFEWTVPATTEPGQHTIVLQGATSGRAEDAFEVILPGAVMAAATREALATTGSAAPWVWTLSAIIVTASGAVMLLSRRARAMQAR